MFNFEPLMRLSFGLMLWVESYRIFTIYRVFHLLAFLVQRVMRFFFKKIHIFKITVQSIRIFYFPRRRRYIHTTRETGKPRYPRGKFITYLSPSWCNHRLACVVNKLELSPPEYNNEF